MKSKKEVTAEIELSLKSMNDEFGLDLFTVSFHVAKEIVNFGDASFLDIVPLEVKKEVISYAKLYLKDGYLHYYSSIGEIDHSKMAKQLAKILLDNKVI